MNYSLVIPKTFSISLFKKAIFRKLKVVSFFILSLIFFSLILQIYIVNKLYYKKRALSLENEKLFEEVAKLKIELTKENLNLDKVVLEFEKQNPASVKYIRILSEKFTHNE